MQRMRPCLVENLPRRVSRQRIVPSPLADPMLYNMQAGGNTCPAEPLGETIRSHNVPSRLSRQCVSVPGDSMLVNLQAGGNSCPVEPLDEPSSLCERPRCCDRSRNSVSVKSMSNYLQAGGDTCPAGPLDDADSLMNLPRRCGRWRIPDSFFLSSFTPML